ncbi:MAG: HD domain-containing phosphohydrolase [Thermodesulfobacteriota bacterium]
MLQDKLPERHTVLVVDDESSIVRLSKRILDRNGYRVITAESAEEARARLREQPIHLILTDINMPGESGLNLIASIRDEFKETAAVMVSGIDDPITAGQALDLGVYGYIIKPFEPNELIINVANALRRRSLEIKNRRYQEHLEEEVQARTAQLRATLQRLEEASLDTIMRLSKAGEFKDEDTGAHIVRISRFAAVVAKRLGLGEQTATRILYAAPMHDIGKIGVPDHILLKPGPLDSDELAIMKNHTRIGADILGSARSGFLQLAEVIALTHHEKWDGTGYPLGLKGKTIPLAGQVTAIVDVFDALTSRRPYKPAFSLERTYEIIVAGKGRHFCPEVVEAFFQVREEIEAIRDEYRDNTEKMPVGRQRPSIV